MTVQVEKRPLPSLGDHREQPPRRIAPLRPSDADLHHKPSGSVQAAGADLLAPNSRSLSCVRPDRGHRMIVAAPACRRGRPRRPGREIGRSGARTIRNGVRVREGPARGSATTAERRPRRVAGRSEWRSYGGPRAGYGMPRATAIARFRAPWLAARRVRACALSGSYYVQEPAFYRLAPAPRGHAGSTATGSFVLMALRRPDRSCWSMDDPPSGPGTKRRMSARSQWRSCAARMYGAGSDGP
jgi:hypothetical protein